MNTYKHSSFIDNIVLKMNVLIYLPNTHTYQENIDIIIRNRPIQNNSEDFIIAFQVINRTNKQNQ